MTTPNELHRLVVEVDAETLAAIDAARRAAPGPGVPARCQIVRDILRRALVVVSPAALEASRASRLTAAELQREGAAQTTRAA